MQRYQVGIPPKKGIAYFSDAEVGSELPIVYGDPVTKRGASETVWGVKNARTGTFTVRSKEETQRGMRIEGSMGDASATLFVYPRFSSVRLNVSV